MLIFDDDSEDDWNRVKVLERLSQVTLPPGVQPQMGADFSPVGQIYFFTLHTTNPAYDAMDLKSIEDWTIEKQFKSVPDVVGVASFGGPTREYQVRVDPNKLVAYGLTLGQLEQQLSSNNVNGGGSFIEAGLQQINVRAVGQLKTVGDIERTVLHDEERDAGSREGHRSRAGGTEDPARSIRQSRSPRRRTHRRQR
jgi:heavy metal efflux system protein